MTEPPKHTFQTPNLRRYDWMSGDSNLAMIYKEILSDLPAPLPNYWVLAKNQNQKVFKSPFYWFAGTQMTLVFIGKSLFWRVEAQK